MSEADKSLQDEMIAAWSRKGSLNKGDLQLHKQPKIVTPSSLGLYTYVPRSDAKFWLQRVTFVMLLCGASSILLWQCCSFFPGLQSIVFGFFKWVLIPIKPLLISAPIASAGGVIGFLTAISYSVNLAIIPIAAFLALKAAEPPLFLHVRNDKLFVLERNVSRYNNIGMNAGQVIKIHNTYYLVRGYYNLDSSTAVSLLRPRGKKSSKDYVLTFESADAPKFKLRWGDVMSAADRGALFEKLEARYRSLISPEILEPFRPMINHQSYTELWLRELSDAPKRDKLTPLEPGAVLDHGNYCIINRAGVGGQGTAYFASSKKHAELGKAEVVLKEYVLPVYPDVRVRKKAAERFQAEAAMLKRLNHPQIAQFIDLFVEDHRAYVVMELVEGQSLKGMVANEGPSPEEFVVDIASQILEVLVYLHSQSPPVIHRDLTPDNIMLGLDGRAKLIDFSVAQEASSGVTGSVVGKPNYIAPEQFRGKPTTQSDIYSLGATMHYLLVAQEPSPISIQRPQLINDKVSNKLNDIVARCTQPDVTKRFAGAEEVLAALRSI